MLITDSNHAGPRIHSHQRGAIEDAQQGFSGHLPPPALEDGEIQPLPSLLGIHKGLQICGCREQSRSDRGFLRTGLENRLEQIGPAGGVRVRLGEPANFGAFGRRYGEAGVDAGQQGLAVAGDER